MFFSNTGVTKLGGRSSNIIKIENLSLLAAGFHSVCYEENGIHQVLGSLGCGDAPKSSFLFPKKGP